jgi:hypothetical protein
MYALFIEFYYALFLFLFLFFFKDNYIPIISYTYTTPMATKLFNYKMALQDFNIDDFKPKPPDSTCARSSFIYIPAGHIVGWQTKVCLFQLS